MLESVNDRAARCSCFDSPSYTWSLSSRLCPSSLLSMYNSSVTLSLLFFYIIMKRQTLISLLIIFIQPPVSFKNTCDLGLPLKMLIVILFFFCKYSFLTFLIN